MKNLLTLLFISISMACLAQAPKPEPAQIDTTIVLNPWHVQQISAFDAEIKRLQATTIEAEVQRLLGQKQLIINSVLVAKINDPSRIKDMGQINGNKIPLVLTPIKQPSKPKK